MREICDVGPASAEVRNGERARANGLPRSRCSSLFSRSYTSTHPRPKKPRVLRDPPPSRLSTAAARPGEHCDCTPPHRARRRRRRSRGSLAACLHRSRQQELDRIRIGNREMPCLAIGDKPSQDIKRVGLRTARGSAPEPPAWMPTPSPRCRHRCAGACSGSACAEACCRAMMRRRWGIGNMAVASAPTARCASRPPTEPGASVRCAIAPGHRSLRNGCARSILSASTTTTRPGPGRKWGNKRAEQPVATENERLTRPIGSSTFRFARLNLLSVNSIVRSAVAACAPTSR